ncbi:hypothetical protein GCM10022240_09100 [Microbacterium kribbense]|uniref:Uncharacterized protein n=1 Tax=Microbacterium kribbense TaxID=433645 RepID=A0ABP7G7S2_9MICO
MTLSPGADVLLVAIWSICLFLVLCVVLVLIVISLRRPATTRLSVAAGLVVLALLIAAIAPVRVPSLMGVLVAILGITAAVLGGNPLTRHVLQIAAGDRVRETDDGGIVLTATEPDAATGATRTLMRGGTVIGYLERLAAVLSILTGYPAAIAVIVAVKSVGRFSELAAAEARERFIIGTMTSLLWSCAVGVLLRLAIG